MNAQIGFTAKIVPELLPLARPITDAIPHPDNPRKHRVDKIAKSLLKHGQRSAIVVQVSTGYIVKGNGTHEAARMLGWDTIAMVFQELTDAEAYPYLLDDNKASDESSYDNEKLHAGLTKLAEGPGFGDSLWTIEEFEDLDEQINGTAVLAPAETGAAYINDDAIDDAKKEALKNVAKMREVPVMMEAVDYPIFMEWVRVLQKQWKASGSQVTIIECVRRQYEFETTGEVTVGQAASQKQIDHAVKLVLSDLRTITEARYSGPGVMPLADLQTLIAGYMPKAEPIQQVAGQTEAFPLDDPSVPGGTSADGESGPGPEGEYAAVVDPDGGMHPAVTATAPDPAITDDELAAELDAQEDAEFQEAIYRESEISGQ